MANIIRADQVTLNEWGRYGRSEASGETLLLSKEFNHKNHYDVTGKIFLPDPRLVVDQVCDILKGRYPKVNLRPVRQAFDIFARLYTGEMPGYLSCETWYHDAQHSLDCALAVARLVEGHDRNAPKAEQLGERRAVLGVIAALFHDAGYIRKTTDEAKHGAEFTMCHVARSGEFLATIFPEVGLENDIEMISQLVHFTGYEVSLDKIQVQHPLDRRLGFMLGTADLLAQMSDRCYLEKCYECLYAEFEVCGLAGQSRPGAPNPVYDSPDDLVRKSPGFMDGIWRDRIDGYFEGVYRYLGDHFGDNNPYLDAVKNRRQRVVEVLDGGDIGDTLRRRVDCINAGPLRIILGLDQADPKTVELSRPPAPRYAIPPKN